MIIIKIEFHSATDNTIKEISRMYISNDGTGDEQVGNYDVQIMNKGVQRKDGAVWKCGKVRRFERKRQSVWMLIVRAISACLEGRVI